GSCNTASTGCTTKCSGSCTTTSTGATCSGQCRGKCSVALSSEDCQGPIDCAANEQCKAICSLKGALETKCPTITSAEVRIAGDYAVYDAVNKHIGEFATLTNELLVVRGALERVADRTPGDFKSIGLVSDRGFRCVDAGNQAAIQARTLITDALAASDVL